MNYTPRAAKTGAKMNRQAVNVVKIAPVVPIVSVVMIVVTLMFYSVQHSWQYLAMTALMLITGFVSLYALNSAMKQRISLAAYILLGIVLIYFPISTLFWSGVTLAFTVGILIYANALAQLILLSEERLLAFVLSLVSAALPVVFDTIPLSWQRYDVTQWIFSHIFAYAILGGGIVLVGWGLVIAYQNIKNLGWRLGVALVFGGLSVALAIGFAFFIAGTIFPPYQIFDQPLWSTIVTYSGVSIAVTLVCVLLGLRVSRSISRRLSAFATIAARISEGEWGLALPISQEDELSEFARVFNTMSARLKKSVEVLEQRVDERTRRLKAVAEVSQTATGELDPDRLIHQVVNLVQEQFQLYYVGLFLVEESAEGRFAVLRAGTGEAGREMEAQGWHLPVGGESMIGQCILTGLLRVKQTELDIIPRLANIYLPDTKSELALPLRYGLQVIGAMTIQSERDAAFDEALITLFQNMADQIAIAIENTRLFAEKEAALERADLIQQRYQGQAWREYLLGQEIQGYEQHEGHLAPLGHGLVPEVKLAMNSGPTVREDGKLIVPIIHSGQVVGVLGFERGDASSGWSKEQIDLLQDLAEQLALTADNQRLLDESQKRAAREQVTIEVTEQIRSTLEVNTILETAVREIGEALGLDDLTIEMQGVSPGATE